MAEAKQHNIDIESSPYPTPAPREREVEVTIITPPTSTLSPPPQIGFRVPICTDDGSPPHIKKFNPSQSSEISDLPKYIYPPPDHNRMEYGKNPDEEDDDDDWAFYDKTIRRAFMRKVYGIVCVQICVTTSIILLFSFQEDIRCFVQSNVLYAIPLYIVSIILLLVISCCGEGVRRKSPHNIILLGMFTVTYGLWIGVVAALFESKFVALAGIMTLVITIGLTLFAFQAKIDFTGCRGIMLSMFMVIIISLIIYWAFPEISLESNIVACIAALVLSIFLVTDIQLILFREGISPEEYIFGALSIYLDSIMIFTYVLRLAPQCAG